MALVWAPVDSPSFSGEQLLVQREREHYLVQYSAHTVSYRDRGRYETLKAQEEQANSQDMLLVGPYKVNINSALCFLHFMLPQIVFAKAIHACSSFTTFAGSGHYVCIHSMKQ